uniref:WW and C2 domain containing 2 n=1 Tax=Equus asinus TaxID=9793 RepID=A0A9L0J5X7_EQUAS
MLKDYLSVAQDALRTQKELYHVKEQRLALALDEYVRLNDAYKEKSSSRTSLFSGSSSSTKYDPDILKAEISTTRLRAAQCFIGSNPGRGHGTAHQTTLRQHPTCHN